MKESKVYDLEERTRLFAIDIRKFFRDYKKNYYNIDDIRQVIRSSGSIGASYIEANESLGDKDFLLRVKISRKEAKETIYWLEVLKEISDIKYREEFDKFINEATELMKIFSSIFRKKT